MSKVSSLINASKPSVSLTGRPENRRDLGLCEPSLVQRRLQSRTIFFSAAKPYLGNR